MQLESLLIELCTQETKLERVATPVYDNIYKHMTWLFSKLHVRNISD